MHYLFIIKIVALFCFGIFYFSKMENHFSYIKIIHPDKYQDVNSLFDATKKFVFIDITTLLIVVIPFYFNRNREIERKNIQALQVSRKIILDCILTWFFLILLIISFPM